jgi:aminomuconate-semialdehyde/2-hydroxymuconate-6-semialdehyde dehydrogenase
MAQRLQRIVGHLSFERKTAFSQNGAGSDEKVPILANYIDGKWVKPEGGQYLPVKNPAKDQVIAQLPRSNKKDVDKAAAAAKRAFQTWSRLSSNERADWLDKIADGIQKRFDELAELESINTGKTLGSAKMVDINRSVANFRFFAGAIRHDFTEAHAMGDALNYTHRDAVGPAGLITPWNLPLYLLTWKVAPALAMGNTIIAKASEITPLTANALAEICHQIGLPAGVFNLIGGLGAEAGQALVEHPDVPLISFTGGTVTGKRVAATAGPMFKKLSLELGGKNATIIFADAEFDAAVDGTLRAAFANQGQVCLSGSRIFIEESIYEKFVNAMVAKAKATKPGDPKTSTFGSLVSLEHRDKVEHYVNVARQDGGKILCGGERPKLDPPFDKGAFYLPTIIAGLSYDSRCAQEEIFGPVVTVHPFRTEDELLRMVNSTRYGLAGSMWTTNLKRAHRVARQWETGMIWINCWLHRDLRVPFGGVKDSGIGREGGRFSLEFYSQQKNVCVYH